MTELKNKYYKIKWRLASLTAELRAARRELMAFETDFFKELGIKKEYCNEADCEGQPGCSCRKQEYINSQGFSNLDMITIYCENCNNKHPAHIDDPYCPVCGDVGILTDEVSDD